MTRAGAYRWTALTDDEQNALKDTAVLESAASRQIPLIIFAEPEQTALNHVNIHVWETLRQCFDSCEKVGDHPSPGWTTYVFFDVARSSL